MRDTLSPLTTILAALAAITVFATGVWMAQPWSGNGIYENAWSYLVLLAMLAWDCSPHVVLALLSLRPNAPAALVVARFVVALVVCGLGAWIVVDAAFVHTDAQSAIVLVVLPVYQWFLIGVGEGVGRLIARRRLAA